jgi:hypothetical protein
MHGILGHVRKNDEAQAIVRETMGHLVPGSYLNLADGTSDVNAAFSEAQDDYNETGAVPYHLRSPEEFARLFEGLELVEPGVVSCPRWRPEPAPGGPPADLDVYGGVGRKP